MEGGTSPENVRKFRSIMGHLPTAVTAIVAKTGQSPAGMVVGTFTSISINPLLVGFLPVTASRSWQAVRDAGEFTASILASDQRDVAANLAGRSANKLDGVDLTEVGERALVVARCTAWLHCRIQGEAIAGDHTLVLATPLEFAIVRGVAAPLIFARGSYHRTMQVEELIAPAWS